MFVINSAFFCSVVAPETGMGAITEKQIPFRLPRAPKKLFKDGN